MVHFSNWALPAALALTSWSSQDSTFVSAMTPNPQLYDIEQADGSVIQAQMVGSEDDPVEEDDEGFVIIGGGKSGNEYEFAIPDPETGDLMPSGVKATERNRRPAGARKGLRRSAKARQQMGLGGAGPSGRKRVSARGRGTGGSGGTSSGGTTGGSGRTGGIGGRFGGRRNLVRQSHIDLYEEWDEEVEDFHRRTMEWTGTKRNLVVPMRFAGHEGRWLPTKANLNILFNNVGPDATYAPTGSVRDVFKVSSYGKLDMVSDVVDWVPLSQTESYYANGARGYTTQMHQAMKEALNYLENTVKLDFSKYDSDNDGLIDAICFLHSGYAAEWGGNAEDGANYMDRIWSHKWSLYSFREPSTSRVPGWTSSRHNVRVYNYHISPAVYGTWPSKRAVKDKMGRIGVIAHETGHFLGITDLYDKAGDVGNGIGSWGLMANSWGFNNDQWCIPIFSPWSKKELGWLSPQEITASGTFNIGPSYNTQDVKIIKQGYPSNEYLMIEYRKKTGLESCLPADGLLIWKIDDNHDYDHQGWPGQPGWPDNDKHYRISVLPADGAYDLEQSKNRGDGEDLFRAGYKDYLGPGTAKGNTPVYPNTDSYQGGNIRETGIVIDKIGAGGGATMSFSVTMPSGAPASSPVSAPGPSACSGTEKKVIVSIKTDNFASETSWEISDVGGGKSKIQTGGPYEDGKATQYSAEYCLPAASCYKFLLKDSGGDGIQGAGNGYKVTWGGTVVDEMKNNPSFSTTGVDFGDSCIPDGNMSVGTGLEGGHKYFGNMFDIRAKKDIVIRRLASIHTTSTNTYALKVYTKNGSYKGYEKDASAWTLVLEQTVTGKGFKQETPMGNANFSENVAVLADTTQAFYVVMDRAEMAFLYSRTLIEGTTFKSFDDLDFMVGTYNNIDFGYNGAPGVWNGMVVYGTLKAESSGSMGVEGAAAAPEVEVSDEEIPEESAAPLDPEVETAIAEAEEEISANGGEPLAIMEEGMELPAVVEQDESVRQLRGVIQ